MNKRRKELHKELFGNVIKAIDEMIENFPCVDCLDGYDYNKCWEDLKDELINFNT